MTLRNILPGIADDDFVITRNNKFNVPFSSTSRTEEFLSSEDIDSSATLSVGSTERTNIDENGNTQTTQGTPGNPPYDNETFVNMATSANKKVSGRLKNPLSYLATYTYQLSLYLISPGAYEGFIASGRRNVNIFNQADSGNKKSKTYLLAQGGGIGQEQFRAPGFEFDYFIDKLNIETILPAKGGNGNNVTINYKFSVTEPYGFSFVSNLARAQQDILNDSAYNFSDKAKENMQQPHNTTRNFFILGIRFFGWDEKGNLMKGDEIMPDGKPLDPVAPGTGALFETFQEIVFTSFKFKVDGRSTVYNIEAQPVGLNGAINVRKGMVANAREVYGSTVRDMLTGEQGLITLLNKEQKELQESGSIEKATVYKIKWQNAEDIATSSIITDNIQNKSVQANDSSSNTKEANAAAETAAIPNKNLRKLSIPAVPIVQAIEQIIGSSRYIQDALTKNYTDDNESNQEDKQFNSKQGTGKELKWFSISPELSNIKWDNNRNDWVYDITYVIQPYLIPNVPAPYVNNTTDYYGPHKRYDYWYTGKNTEIIGYEQVINNNYFLATLAGDGSGSDKVQSPVLTNTIPGGDKTGAQGTSSYASLNAFRTSLADPSSFVKAKIQVLGDPDYLMSSTASSLSSTNYYDETGKINATTQQVFMEIDFKEAYDYNTGDSDLSLTLNGQKGGVYGQPGVMALNDSIEFWKYEGDAENIKGVSYQILNVKSNFTGGNFTQHIDAVINPFVAPDASAEEEEQRENDETDDNSRTTQMIDLGFKMLGGTPPTRSPTGNGET